MNSQSAAVVQGIQSSPLLLFIAAKALEMIGSSVDKEDIFFARAASIVRM